MSTTPQTAPAPATQEKTCLGCGRRHPFDANGAPIGGALPCGH